MKKHVTIALKSRHLTGCETHPCEICGQEHLLQNMDVHHIIARSVAKKEWKDNPLNLIICCRECHAKAHEWEPPAVKLLDQVEKILEVMK